MSEKKVFSIERLTELQREFAEFNRCELGDMMLTENGVPVELSPGLLNDWRYVGLSNMSFLEMEVWKCESINDLFAMSDIGDVKKE